jgi:hypothetical protein
MVTLPPFNVPLLFWPISETAHSAWQRRTVQETFAQQSFAVRQDIAALIGRKGAVTIAAHSLPDNYPSLGHVIYRPDRVDIALTDAAPVAVLLHALVQLLLHLEGYPSIIETNDDGLSTALLNSEFERRVAGYDHRARCFYKASMMGFMRAPTTPASPRSLLSAYVQVAGSSLDRSAVSKAWLGRFQERHAAIAHVGAELLRARGSFLEMSDPVSATRAMQRMVTVIRHHGLGDLSIRSRRQEFLDLCNGAWREQCDSYLAIFELMARSAESPTGEVA